MTEKLSETECFALLGNRRRLLAVQILREQCAEYLSMCELAEGVAERAHDDPTATERHEVHLSLYHTHIPRLEQADVVAYDRDDDSVAIRPNAETLMPFIAQLTEDDLAACDS